MTSTCFLCQQCSSFSRFICYFAINLLYLGPTNVNRPQLYGQQARAIRTGFQMQYFYIATVSKEVVPAGITCVNSFQHCSL